MNNYFFLIIILFFTTFTDAKSSSLKDFNSSNAFNNVKELISISPRDAGTPNGHKAAHYLYQKLESFNIETELQFFNDSTPDGVKKMVNVVGTINCK